MKNNLIYWFRWVAVLPGALLAGILATFPLHWLLQLLFTNSQEIDVFSIRFFLELFAHNITANDVEYLFSPFVIAAAFVFAGYKIAPKYKFITASVLFGIYVVTWSIGVIFVTFNKIAPGYEFSGRTILALLGAIIGLCAARTVDKENKGEIEG